MNFLWQDLRRRNKLTAAAFAHGPENNGPSGLPVPTLSPGGFELNRVTIEDGVAADEIFTTLMGDEVEPRREFIEKHALQVTNLDI